MNVLTDREGRNVPFFVDFYERHSISTEDFSPTEDASLTDEEIGMYEEKGFLVRPNADGDLYGITLYAYKNNLNPVTKLPYLTGLVPEAFDGITSQWIECRYIKIFAHNDGVYPSTATSITVGVTI